MTLTRSQIKFAKMRLFFVRSIISQLVATREPLNGFSYRVSPTYERPTYERPHLRTGGRRATTRTCEQLFTLRTWVSSRDRQVSSSEQTTYERNLERNPFVSWEHPVFDIGATFQLRLNRAKVTDSSHED
jgi:hypothetical protein